MEFVCLVHRCHHSNWHRKTLRDSSSNSTKGQLCQCRWFVIWLMFFQICIKLLDKWIPVKEWEILAECTNNSGEKTLIPSQNSLLSIDLFKHVKCVFVFQLLTVFSVDLGLNDSFGKIHGVDQGVGDGWCQCSRSCFFKWSKTHGYNSQV